MIEMQQGSRCHGGVMMTGHDGGRLLLNLDQLIDLFCQDTYNSRISQKEARREAWVGGYDEPVQSCGVAAI